MQVGFSGGVPSSVACPVLDMWVCLQKTGKPDMAGCAIRHRISVAFRTPTRVYVPTHVYVPSRKFSTCTELVGIVLPQHHEVFICSLRFQERSQHSSWTSKHSPYLQLQCTPSFRVPGFEGAELLTLFAAAKETLPNSDRPPNQDLIVGHRVSPRPFR